MSDITPADALRELGDDQAEYAAAAAKKLGLPESVEYVEMRTEYGVRDRNGTEWWPGTRKSAEDAVMDGGGSLIIREHITTAAREVAP